MVITGCDLQFLFVIRSDDDNLLVSCAFGTILANQITGIFAFEQLNYGVLITNWDNYYRK